jgi:DegV family protein with EDD domain
MGRVIVITDSSICLPPGTVSGAALSVVPIVLHLPWGDVRGDPAAMAKAVYEALAEERPVKSSAPSPLEYLEAIDRADASSAVIITPAAELTVMYRNACVAAGLASCPVEVVDSRTAAAAHSLVVLEAADAAAAGGSATEIRAAAVAASRRTGLVAALDRVDFIRRSGRVSSVALGLAEHLGIRPVFELRDGTVERLAVPRSEGAALRRIVQEATDRGLAGARRTVVFHAACPKRAEALRALAGGSDLVTEFSPSMGIHTGPGVVGIAWLAA